MQINVSIREPIGIGFGNITAAELSQQDAEAQLQKIKESLVRVDSNALATCFDDRLGGFNGPKLAGGFKSLQVGAKAVGYDAEDAELMARASERGYYLSAHVDSKNKNENFVNGTGCGANDKEEGNDGLFNTHKDALSGMVAELVSVNGAFDEAAYRTLELSPVTNDKNALRNIIGEENTEVLLVDGEGANGSGHSEWTVFFNYVPNTTVDREAYYKATGKKLFCVDMWYIKELADHMAEGVDAEAQANQMYQAMVAFQIGTYLGLCDGTHRPTFATPEQFATAA